MQTIRATAILPENILYSLIRFLWILVLLPKEAQFAAYTSIVIWYSVRNRKLIRLNRVTACFLAYAGIHLISIIIAVAVRDYPIVRIAAAINTCGIWLLAIWITGIISESEEIDLDRIGRYCTINFSILFMVFIITFFFPDIYIFNGMERRLTWTWDLLSSGETTRFIGLFEYPALVSFFTLLQFPYAFRYLSESRYKWSCLILIPMVLAPVFMTYSRMGILVNGMMAFAAVNYFILKNGVRPKRLMVIYGILFLLLLVCIAIKMDEIMALIYNILHVRPGSNSDRMRIYTETVNRISETSWIVGAGIKEMNSAGAYPLGSHCTYLGIIFKSGILGGICFTAGLAGTIVNAVKKTARSHDLFDILMLVMLILVMVFCILEDIDGADWLLVMTMGVITVWINQENRVPEM